MYSGKLVFSQLMDFLPMHQFRCCVDKYNGNYHIKSFFGTSENAVRTQIWIAISVYVLVSIVKKRLMLDNMSLYTILQILSVTLFEKTQLLKLVTMSAYNIPHSDSEKQLKLFDY